MAGAYSTDLRGRVLAAMEAGETPDAAARRFAVARSTAYRWATAARDEGRRAARPVAGGPAPRITGEAEAALVGALEADDHLTLAECRARVAGRTGVRVHPWTIGRALKRLGWTRKKRDLRAAEQEREDVARARQAWAGDPAGVAGIARSAWVLG
jgi:transposase